LTIGLDAMLKTIQLPTGVSDLDSGLSHVDRDTLTHFVFEKFSFEE